MFRNGRWRSEWSVSFTPGGVGELKGILKVQVMQFTCGTVIFNF
jgi:hypothetical protein